MNDTNKTAGVKLAGTLTTPRTGGPFPAVVLYNTFTRRIRESTGRMESLGALVLPRSEEPARLSGSRRRDEASASSA